MTVDVYSRAIDYVCEYYNITRHDCVEFYWEEVENVMELLLLWSSHE